MIERQIPHFDMEQICDSGQCFRMDKLGDGYYRVLAGNRRLKLRQRAERVSFYCSEKEFADFWENYFDLGADYGKYLERIDPKDRYLTEAAVNGSGIRILRQDLWEMIVSFLISQQNHIGRIRRCIGNICVRYGERIADRNEEAEAAETGENRMDGAGYGFPTPGALAKATEEELRDCNLGYRAKYVLRTAQMVDQGDISLEEIGKMEYPRAKASLMELYGVGEKVADCICLFALHQMEAFPVDTHIRQALDAHYRSGFPKRKYAGIQGVLQQYIFYYELTGAGKQP